MKLILTILLFYSVRANATNYFVSNAGSNGSNGLTTGAPWQTIAKINQSSFSAGDSIFFKRGDTWVERLIVPSSNIYFGAYGTGNKPTITGLETQTGFTNAANIWTTTATNASATLNTVVVNGRLRAKARTPNTGYLTFSSYSGSPKITSITGTLTGTPNYTGSEIVVRTTHWLIDRSKITSQSGGVINFLPGLTYDQTFGGNGYFIQNTPSDLDLPGEWIYDSASRVLRVFSIASPTVQLATIDTLVWLRSKSYVTFDGLAITGANKTAFQLDTAYHVTVKNCSINYTGELGISAIKSTGTSIISDSIQNVLSNSIYLRQVDPYTPTVNTCDSSIIKGNYIKNNAIYAGMGQSNNGRYIGIYIIGNGTIIANNILDSSGYTGIFFNGKNSVVEHNLIKNTCFLKDDGGSIYTVVGGYLPADFNDGSRITGNIILNSIGASAGTTSASIAAGIYLDDATRNVLVDSNTIDNAFTAGIFLHDATSIKLRENIVVDSLGDCLRVQGYDIIVLSLETKRNTFYSKSSFNYLYNRSFGEFIGNADTNYYHRSLLTGAFNFNAMQKTFAQWQSSTGKEANSTMGVNGATASPPMLYYNPTAADSTLSIPGYRITSKGVRIANSIILKPFTSVLLFDAVPILGTSIKRINFTNKKTSFKLKSS